MLKYIINFFVCLGNISQFIAECLRKANLHEEYYVYVSNFNKPKYIHKNYKEAWKEAKRLEKKFEKEKISYGKIEILQIVNRFKDIPFQQGKRQC